MDNYTLAMGDAFREELDKIAKCGPGKVRSGRRPVRAAKLLKEAAKEITFRKVGPHVITAAGTLIGVDQLKKHYKAHKIGRQYQKQMKQQRG
tara:strand:- start:252 stop:527 length:276 start_codon:yes stop_codon:yes gene_type:complete